MTKTEINNRRERKTCQILGAIDTIDPFGNRFEISVPIANLPSINILSK